MNVDGDTNEPLNTVIPNNGTDVSDVQPISNPVALSGFLGNLDSTIDVWDVYAVQLFKGQSITLVMGDPTQHDFDLGLFDTSYNLIDSSEGTGQYEAITVPEDGDYFIGIFGYSVYYEADSGGLYNLFIGSDTAAAESRDYQMTRLSRFDAKVEGEVLTAFKPSVRNSVSAASLAPLMPQVNVMSVRQGAGGVQRVKVALKSSTRQSSTATRLFNLPQDPTIAAIKALRQQPDTKYAEPNYVSKAFAVPNDTYYSYQWHYPLINLPQAWDETTGDAAVIVAVIDTGVVLAHPDLQGQLVDGYDMISYPEISLDGDGIDNDPNDPGDKAMPDGSSSFHGTHVSGTVAAKSNNGEGVAGVAWNVKIMPVRVLGYGGGTDYDIVQGIRYAAGLSNDSGTVPAKAADVINMSLGGEGYSQAEQDAITAARQAGVIVVVAAGNDNVDAGNYTPAGLNGVITVSAVDFAAEKAPYSNYGSTVEVAAPGGDTTVDLNQDGYVDGVLSTSATDAGGFSYVFLQGTSMASPHMAGVVALMKSVDPDLTPADVDLLLAKNHPSTARSITIDKGSAGKDPIYGYGLIDAYSAVLAAKELAGSGTPVDQPILGVSPQSLNFGTTVSTLGLQLYNNGAGTLEVTQIVLSDTWMSMNLIDETTGQFEVSVVRDELQPGTYDGNISISSNGGDVVVPVRMLVLDQTVGQGGDVGTVAVLMVDSQSYETVTGMYTDKANGYAFSFSDLPDGSYYLVAGTDLDGNNYIDDSGELFGIYPDSNNYSVITVPHQLGDGLNFSLYNLIYLPEQSSFAKSRWFLSPASWMK